MEKINDFQISENPVIGFFGLGLIGGSIARALRNALPGAVIKACDRDRASLDLALRDGVVNEAFDTPSGDFLSCEVLFLCAPVLENDSMILELSDKIGDNTLITDVGSVKKSTCQAIASTPLAKAFIGGHPMAGSEKTGYANSGASLLENAYYILTPSEQVSEEKVAFFRELIAKTGAIPIVMSPDKHDEVTAAISHLPHIVAAALVSLIRDMDDEDRTMKLIAAGGFKDITRIASSSPVMWQSICRANSENITDMLEAYIRSLEEILSIVQKRDLDALYQLFSGAKEYRDSFQIADHGPIKKVHDLYVDIPDVPGSLAKTATILADQDLSIKNIGIMHSREFQEGALRIEFYDDATAAKAAEVLRGEGYRLFR
ncbi:MAG: prephenate dehydrogenase [Lachnospiraceae bacterium]|nr:prephenate dehydrogenase [Lachnospiraceae bacterium]